MAEDMRIWGFNSIGPFFHLCQQDWSRDEQGRSQLEAPKEKRRSEGTETQTMGGGAGRAIRGAGGRPRRVDPEAAPESKACSQDGRAARVRSSGTEGNRAAAVLSCGLRSALTAPVTTCTLQARPLPRRRGAGGGGRGARSGAFHRVRDDACREERRRSNLLSTRARSRDWITAHVA